ncbi:MAG: TetR family transcriptional regulator [Caulobacter sp.]|jgi:AcrR family transcriptional regulator|nr:TetR family transcriptional regulator [Caulobacter sp.]
MPRLTGQIDLSKTEAILDAASEVLAERGLAAPIEEIARRAGVSKQTIYNRYGGKIELVRALVEKRVDSITSPLRSPGAEEHPEETLTAYARSLLQVIERGGYSLMRLTIQSAGELPELAREVYANGPMRSRAQLAEFLEREHRAGRLRVEDPMQAAEFFGGMVMANRQIQALLRLPTGLTDEVIERLAGEAARVFMRAYAV